MSAPRPLPPDMCFLCLSTDRKIFRLSASFNHLFGFLTNWYPQTDARVCWECRATLERLQRFKAQAERAVWLLECSRTESQPTKFRSLSLLDTSNLVIIDLLIYNNANSKIIKELSADNHVSTRAEDESAELQPEPDVEERNDQRNVGTEFVYIDTVDNITDFFKSEVTADINTEFRDDYSSDADEQDGNVDRSKCKKIVLSDDDQAVRNDIGQMNISLTSYDVAGPSTSKKEDRISRMILKDTQKTETEKESKARRAEEQKYELYQQGKTFECDHCGKIFPTRTHINTHMKVHYENIKCELCDFKCSIIEHLRDHTLTHLDPSRWPYECHECHMKFLHKNQMITHTRGEHPFKCEKCGRVFANKQNRTWHLNNKHTVERKFAQPRAQSIVPTEPAEKRNEKVEEANYECHHCGKVFKHRRKATVHIKRHNKNVMCDQCPYSCHGQSRLKQHMLVHLDPSYRPYECELCHKRFIDRYKLLLHTRTHTGERPFICNMCDKAFISKEDLTAHTKKVHTVGESGISKVVQPRTKSFYRNRWNKSTPKQCDVSKKTFSNCDAFRRRSHNKKYPCSACENTFKYRSMLMQHVNEVHGGKPYECNICGLKFVNKFRLRGHMVAHSDEKRFQCDQCPLTFKYQSGLWGHKLLHRGEKPHQCDICKARFTLKGNLDCHMKIHTNDRPFECDVCGKKFPRKRNLKNHLNTHMKEQQQIPLL